jgi:chorismate synthase
VVSGLPAGLPVDPEFINRELWRRQQGYGRGGRMRIERDSAHILSGVYHGNTIGSPVAIEIENRDWKNWTEILPVAAGDPAKHKVVSSPRPGHALGIDVASHVIRVGHAELDRDATWDQIAALRSNDEVLLNCVDPAAEERMKAEVDQVLRTGDSIGGVFEVIVHGAPAGIGTYANWDERLDGILAAAVMSLQAVKAVEIGRGVTSAQSYGSEVHDPIGYSEHENGAHTRFTREHNNAGGIEGGVSNGEDIVIRGYLKPISTLRRPLASVRFDTREPTKAAYERSDVCVVPAAGVAAEAMVALAVARLALEKFGGDSLTELRRNYDGYLDQIRRY